MQSSSPAGGRRSESFGAMNDTSRTEDSPPLTQTRQFWVLLGYAAALGVVGALASLIFMGVIGFGDNWYVVANPGWFGGQWWWIAVTAAAGVVVGLLRRVTRLPEHTPGLIADLQEGRVEPRLVPGIVAVSAVSLIGGASLGPEKALGSIGGGAGTWVSRRRRLGAEDSQVNTLAGFGGAYGGLFSSTVIVVMMIMEVARPGGRQFTKALVGAVVASSVSFAIYFAIAGSVFLDAYPVPHYQYEDWQLLAAVPLGLFAAVVTTLLGTFVKLSAMLFDRLKLPGVVKSRAQRRGDALAVLVGHEPHGCPNEVHRAGLHHRLGPGGLDRLGEPGQPVAAHDQHVADPAVAQLRAHPGPELRPLDRLDPDPEHVLDPVQVDPDGQVRGPVADLVPVPDLDHQGVQVEDRVDLLQRPALPGLDLLEHRVGDRGDGVVGQLHAQRAGQMVGDVAHGHPAQIRSAARSSGWSGWHCH